MHHSSFAQRHSQFAMRHSSFPLRYSQFSARYGSFLCTIGCSLCTIEYLLMLVAKLQLNSDIPTNSDKIFIVFPVFLFLPLPSRRAHLHNIYDHLCENYDHLHAAGGTSTKIMMTFTKIIMASTKIMMTFVKIIMTSTNDITTSAFLLSISATPQVLFTPKEHLPKPVQVNGVTPEVLIFSAETLVV